MLRRAKTIFSNPAATKWKPSASPRNPFPEYTKGLTPSQTIAFFKDLDALAEREKFRSRHLATKCLVLAMMSARRSA